MGADAAVVWLCKYGPPPSASAMLHIARKHRADEVWKTYIAEMLWVPAAVLSGDKSLVRYPQLIKSPRNQGNQLTNEQVRKHVDDMLDMFLPGEDA